jgi:nucleolar complex protein 2
MAKTQKKSTKKFEKKHLKGALERRKEFAKIKQRKQQQQKKSQKNKPEENGKDEEVHEPVQSKQNSFKDMTVDDFFSGGFDLPEKKSKKRKRSTLEQNTDNEEDNESELGHKEDLEGLAEKDPEFYNYLKENDAELLDFNIPLSDDDAEQDNSVMMDQAEQDKSVTIAMVQKWEKGLTQNSIKALKEVVLAFRAAVDTEKKHKYTISSPEVYHQLLTISLKQIPITIQHHLPVLRSKVSTETKKFKTLTPILMAYINSITHLLHNLSDDGTLSLTLSSIEPLLPHILSFKKILKNLVKTIVGIWSDSTEIPRINAFLLVRKLSDIADLSIREAILKSAYQSLVKSSRNTTVYTISGINLMKNSAVDLWRPDSLGYTTAFTYIRQLAIHLRTTMTKPTKDSYKAIYNWQYVHSLDFWSRVFSVHCSTKSALNPLIYPLVQVTLGALRLIPTPTYYPLRFFLVRSLIRLSRSTNTYIPLAPLLVEVLQSPEVRTQPKPSTLRPLDFTTTLRVPKQYIHTKIYQDGIIEEVSELLAEFFGVWAKNVAFPELIIPPMVLIKRWMKDIKRKSSLLLLIQKLELNSEFISKHRRKLEFSPKDREQLDNFLIDLPIEETPIGAYLVTIRKRKEEQQKLLEASRREESKKKDKDYDTDQDEEHDEDQDMDQDMDQDDDTSSESQD